MSRPLHRLPLAAAFLAAVVLVPTSSSSAHRAFHDTTGEVDCCTRDLTSIVVHNDNAGQITFEIHFDGRPEGDDDDDLFVPLDTDRNAATGQTGDWGLGIDHMIGAHIWKGHADAITLSRWTGHGFAEYFVRRIRVFTGTDSIRITLDRHLIGDTNGPENGSPPGSPCA
jgi:hypothetical protein